MKFAPFSQAPPRLAIVLLAAAALLGAPRAAAQTSYSIDYGGPHISLPDSCTGVPITEGDILISPSFLPALGPFFMRPCTVVPGGPAGLGLALHPGCVGHPSGFACGVEVDALSYGLDGPAVPAMPPASFWLSADEFATGFPGMPVPPTADTEGLAGAREACADLFVDLGLPPAPLPPFASPPMHVGAIDGNGFRSASNFAYPGLGLLEWNPPGPPPDLGDNVDAVDVDGPIGPFGFFYSLDSAFVDPLLGIPNGGSAALHGFVGGDVLFTPGGAAPALYAPAPILGLDLIAGADSDDLDALALLENAQAGYQPSQQPYDWVNGATDMLLFSVRRGSAVIGAPDSILGIPIEEGDILTTPLPPALGGVSPFPGMFIAAENIGLMTLRAAGRPDDLDALDVARLAVLDCNGNGREDVIDIVSGFDPDCNRNGVPDSCDVVAGGLSCDSNNNGVPDECEFCAVLPYCTAKVNSLGCTPIAGAFGTPSATCPSPFLVSAVDVPSNKPGLWFYGFNPAAIPFQGGILCVQPPLTRTPVMNSNGTFPPTNCTGVFQIDFNARIQSGIDPSLVVGATVFTQNWHRDPGSPSGTGLTDAVRFSICP